MRDEPGLGPGSSFPLQGGNKKPPYWAPFVTYGEGGKLFLISGRVQGPEWKILVALDLKVLLPITECQTAKSDSSAGQLNLTAQSDRSI